MIPSEEMAPARNPVAAIIMTARQCDRCGEWICNSCVTEKCVNYDVSVIEHYCGGTFKAPQE